MRKIIVLTKDNWLRMAAPVGLALFFTILILASMACKLSSIQTIITPFFNSTPTEMPFGEGSKSWSSAPTPLPEITFPPPIEDQSIIDQAEELYQQGREAYTAKNWQAALDAFNQALQLNPRHASAYTYRGWTYLNRGDQNALSTYLENNNQAVMDFTRSITLDPSQWLPYYGRGYCFSHRATVEPICENRKQWRELALNDLDHALELDPSQGWARAERVSIYIDIGECDKALDELLTPDWSHYPTSEEILLQLKTDLCQKNYPEAMRLVSEQLTNGEDANLYWERGLIYAGQKEYEKALADLDTAARLWSGDFAPGTLWYNRAAIEYRLGNYDLVKEYIQQGRLQTWIDWGSPYYFLEKCT